jgi:hypothetical protein
MKRLLDMFRMPSPEVCALRELEDAKRQLLVALSTSEYATKMAQYHQGRVVRLSRSLGVEVS